MFGLCERVTQAFSTKSHHTEPHRATHEGFLAMSSLLVILLNKCEFLVTQFSLFLFFMLVIAAHLLYMQTVTVEIRLKSEFQKKEKLRTLALSSSALTCILVR